MTRTRSQRGDLTAKIHVTFGAFVVGEYQVPYMTSVLSFRQVQEYLNLVTEDNRYAEQDWKLEELFQRDVDPDRVVEISETYLNPSKLERPRFFNSLTVVLRPKQGEFVTPPKVDDYEHYLGLGSVAVTYEEAAPLTKMPTPGSFGVLQWD